MKTLKTENKPPQIQINYYRKRKGWVAQITGTHPKYKYERKFLNPAEKTRSSSGKTGNNVYTLEEDGIYEIQEPYKDREYRRVKDGEIKIVSESDVEHLIAQDEETYRKHKKGEIK